MTQSSQAKASTPGRLSKGLKTSQVTMISIGGVIGAGFFVGTAAAIQAAGPAVLISFFVAAVLVIIVMGLLGEMATADPDSGSFSTYAQHALGRWAGFSIGWMYWWFYVLVIPLEAIVAANILGAWTGIPSWLIGIVMIGVLTATNLISVKNFGEIEYWLAWIKVVSIVAFIVLGLLAVFGILPGSHTSGVSHLWADGGFAPVGFGGIIAALVLASFSFTGMEIATIAAAESPEPKKSIRRAIRNVIWRMMIFYFGSIFLIVALVPWNSEDLTTGSFFAALTAMNIPNAGTIVDLLILVGVASTLNSAIYTASRMGYSLSTRRDAPRSWGQTTRNGVPRIAILFSSGAAILTLILNYVLPEQVLIPLIATIGSIALIMYLFIAVSQFILRRRADAAGEQLQVRVPWFPVLTIVAIILILTFFVLMLFVPGQQLNLFISVGLFTVLAIVGLVLQRRQPSAPEDTPAALPENAR